MQFAWRLLLAGLLLSATACKNSGVGVGLNPGEVAPDLQLQDLEGKPVTLSQLENKLTLLNFWASWCMPCLAEMPDLKRVHEALDQEGFTVVAVAVEDDLEEVKRLVKEFELPFPVLFDPAGHSKMRFKLRGYPETFLLDSERRMLMVADPADGMPVVRFVGPRDWSHPLVLSQFRKHLK